MPLPFAVEHRPYPASERGWVMWQKWHDLLFAHWPVPVAQLAKLLPKPLEADTHEGQAWISVVPFRMTGIRPRWLPAVPWLSAFAELNARTYVTLDGKPGVYFFSLDAANPVAVRLAKYFFHLPYFDARMKLREANGWIDYESERKDGLARFRGRYQPLDERVDARPGTLDHWLTERYCMYPVDRQGRVYRGEIHHLPWPAQKARAEIEVNTMTEPLGLKLTTEPALVHFSREIHVVVWALERLTQ